MFEYNFISGQLVVSESFSYIFGYEPAENGAIDPALFLRDSKGLLSDMIEQSRNGIRPAPLELLAECADGKKIWCRILVHPSDTIGKEKVSAIGKIINIDDEYRERERLLIASQTDSLTQLLNKGAIEAHICALLEAQPDTKYACWILDVDDFKAVNDTLGHMVGDQLLQETADRLQQLFQRNDILGRIGGDEFIIFAEYNGDSEWLIQQGNRIMNMVRKPMQLNGYVVLPKMSIGIACYPQDAACFSELYQNADKALYRAKAAGKDDYCIYS